MEGKGLARAVAAPLALVLVLAQGSAARAASAPVDTVRVLVHFRAGTTASEHEAVAVSIGGVVDREIPALGVTRIAAPLERGVSASVLVDAISTHASVALAEADARVRLEFAPNDPLWSSDPYSGLGQWGPKKIFLDRALDLITTPLLPVTVAVIDTGVDKTHPDLSGALVEGTTFIASAAPVCLSGPYPIGTDDNSHGTHVAGVIAARANNGIGIVGAAQNARILPIKALDCTGSGAVSDIAQGIVYAVDHGARIINISLGASSDSTTLSNAVQYAISRNVLVVAATGNCGQAPTRCFGTANLVEYPGAYPGVLGVGATAMDDTIAPFSTQGAQVGISAPGVKIVSTTPRYRTYQADVGGATPDYASFSGTSQATPLVSAVAALLLGVDPSLTYAQLAERLRSTADDLGVPGTDPAFGAGRLNAFRALQGVLPTYAARYDASASPKSVASGSTFSARVTVTNTSATTWSSGTAAAVKLAYHWVDANGDIAVWDGARTPLPADVPPSTSLAVNANVIAPPGRGAYTLRFDLVRDGVAWFSQRGVPSGDVQVAVGSGLGVSYAPAATTATLVTGAQTTLPVTLTNTGLRVWSAGGSQPFRLSYHWLRSDGTTEVWDGARAPAFVADVPPGATVTAQLPVIPPLTIGAYVLRLDLVQESVLWASGEGVLPRDVAFTVTSGFGASYSPSAIAPLLPGGRTTTPVILRNAGVSAWSASGANPIRLAAHVVDADGAVVRWDGARTTLATDVAAGATVTYPLTIDAPLAAGAYRARVELVREGVAWFDALGVAPADVSLFVVADYRASLPSGAISVSRAAPTTQITITNTGVAMWTRSGDAPVHIAVHWYDAAGNVLVWDGPRTALPRDVLPGETFTASVALGTPPAGAAALTIDLVAEGLRWFGAGSKRSVALLP